MEQSLKEKIIEAIDKSQEIGIGTIAVLGREEGNDPVSKLLLEFVEGNSFGEPDDVSGVLRNLDYAMNQLTKARTALRNLENPVSTHTPFTQDAPVIC